MVKIIDSHGAHYPYANEEATGTYDDTHCRKCGRLGQWNSNLTVCNVNGRIMPVHKQCPTVDMRDLSQHGSSSRMQSEKICSLCKTDKNKSLNHDSSVTHILNVAKTTGTYSYVLCDHFSHFENNKSPKKIQVDEFCVAKHLNQLHDIYFKGKTKSTLEQQGISFEGVGNVLHIKWRDGQQKSK